MKHQTRSSIKFLAFLTTAAFLFSVASAGEARYNPKPEVGWHRCIHDQLPQNKLAASHQRYAPQLAERNALAAGWEPIRITLDLSLFDSDSYACNGTNTRTVDGWICDQSTDVLTATKRAFLESTVLPQATSWLQLAYSVKRIVGNLVMTQTQCSANSKPLFVPATYRTTGAAGTDLLLFVSARPASSSILAYAAACEIDGKGRPIAGHINFNPFWLRTDIDSTALVYRTHEIVLTAIHEIHHVLGFDTTAMTRFIDPVTEFLRPAGWVLTSMAMGLSNVSAVHTPTVLQVAREYFGCLTLEGVPIEDGGGAGTSGSHWEKRVLMTEFITGSISANPSLSKFTLAFMQDSGWYTANFSMAPDLIWGKGQGCGFIKSRCLPNNAGQFFCNQPSEYGCSFDRVYQAQCLTTDYSSPLQARYQYFNYSQTLGGSDALADYCPYYVPVYSGDCRFGETVIDGDFDFGIVHGTESACFTGTLVFGNNIRPFSGGCYKYRCLGPDLLKIWVKGVWYSCPFGTSIHAIGFNGTLVCPAATENFCSRQVNQTDGSWPTLLDINPRRGGTGTVVTITGVNFASPMVVTVGEYNLSDVVVVNSETITGTVPSQTITASSVLSAETLTYIVVTDARGYTDVAMDSFVLVQDLISNQALSGFLGWMKANVLLVVLIGVTALAIIGIITFLLVRHRNAVQQRIQDAEVAAEAKAAEEKEKKKRLRRKAKAKKGKPKSKIAEVESVVVSPSKEEITPGAH